MSSVELPRRPRVLNIKDHPFLDLPRTVFCGRPGKYGNPHRMKNESERDSVICAFIPYALIHQEMANELRGKDLLCYCAPKDCHCDVWIMMANWREFPDFANKVELMVRRYFEKKLPLSTLTFQKFYDWRLFTMGPAT